MKNRKNSKLTKLLDDVQRILQRDHKSIADLHRELGRKSTAQYDQLYKWLVMRNIKPKGEIVLQLHEWREKNARRSERQSSLR